MYVFAYTPTSQSMLEHAKQQHIQHVKARITLIILAIWIDVLSIWIHFNTISMMVRP